MMIAKPFYKSKHRLRHKPNKFNLNSPTMIWITPANATAAKTYQDHLISLKQLIQ
jgi:hypothetical protein